MIRVRSGTFTALARIACGGGHVAVAADEADVAITGQVADDVRARIGVARLSRVEIDLPAGSPGE